MRGRRFGLGADNAENRSHKACGRRPGGGWRPNGARQVLGPQPADLQSDQRQWSRHPSVTVNFTIVAGGGGLSSTFATTANDGTVISPVWSVGNAVGTNTIRASVPSKRSPVVVITLPVQIELQAFDLFIGQIRVTLRFVSTCCSTINHPLRCLGVPVALHGDLRRRVLDLPEVLGG
jgi:hypothetical protein